MMKQKQLSQAELRARHDQVFSVASVVPLSHIPEQEQKFYGSLTDVKLRQVSEPAWGIYIAESSKVIRRALAAGHAPLSFMMSDKWAADLIDVLEGYPDIPAYVGDENELEAVAGYHLHRGALAVMRRPEPKPLGDLLQSAQRIAVLEDIVDHTNVGAIFRNAAALNIDAVLITPRCADPLYRRSIRVSMGTVFQIPWVRLEDWPGSIEHLQAMGFTVASLALKEDSLSLVELGEMNLQKLALILGTEGHGLGKSTISRSDYTVMIPMASGVDSLNVAAASAVAFWETRPK